MKRSELGKLIGKDISRDEARKKLQTLGLGDWEQSLEMDSVWANAHRDITYTAENGLGLHSHLFYEIIYCVQGEVEYILDTRTVTVSAGDVILVPPGKAHGLLLRNPMQVPYERYVLWVSSQLVESMNIGDPRIPALTHPIKLSTRGTQWEHLRLLFRECVIEEETGAMGCQSCMVAFAVQILVHLIRALEAQELPTHGPKARLQEQILEYIQGNLGKKLSVHDTAQYFHISKSTLTHLFRQNMGTSFYRCVTQRRLLEAKNRIRQGLPMEEISHSVGYPEYSAFYRAFKSEYGISPIQYRQLILRE